MKGGAGACRDHHAVRTAICALASSGGCASQRSRCSPPSARARCRPGGCFDPRSGCCSNFIACTRSETAASTPSGRLRRNPAACAASSTARSAGPSRWREVSEIPIASIKDACSPRSAEVLVSSLPAASVSALKPLIKSQKIRWLGFRATNSLAHLWSFYRPRCNQPLADSSALFLLLLFHVTLDGCSGFVWQSGNVQRPNGAGPFLDC